MFYSANGKSPQLSPTARIAQGARLVGQVQLMENSSVWYNAVLRADNAPITIGEGSNVQDNCTLHTDPNLPHHRWERGQHRSWSHPARLHRRRPLHHRDGCHPAQRRSHRRKLSNRSRRAGHPKHRRACRFSGHWLSRCCPPQSARGGNPAPAICRTGICTRCRRAA